MKNRDADQNTYWNRGLTPPDFPSLQKDTLVDVCVIGGGIAGVSVAYMLAKQGKVVCLIERHKIGSGETHKSTAHLSSALDDGIENLVNAFGADGCRHAIDSHRAAIDKIENIIKSEKIDCDFKRVKGYLFSPDEKDNDFIDGEFSILRSLGYNHVARINRIPFPHYKSGKAICFEGEAVFHPLKYLYALAGLIVHNKGFVYENTEAIKLTKGQFLKIKTSHGNRIFAKSVVIATHTPFIDTKLYRKNVAYRSYALGIRCARHAIPDGLFCDTLNPYHNIRICRFNDDEDMLIAGGEDHMTGEGGPAENYSKRIDDIYQWTKERVPSAGKIEYVWSGQVMEPIDYLAYIGRLDAKTPGLYVVSGGSGHGLTHGTIAGMLIGDMIDGIYNPWADIYNPCRHLKANYKEFILHNLRYFLYMLKRLNLFRKSACKMNCPHMGAPLTWNSFEKSFDCPCHGSRFDKNGNVLNGPTRKGLNI